MCVVCCVISCVWYAVLYHIFVCTSSAGIVDGNLVCSHWLTPAGCRRADCLFEHPPDLNKYHHSPRPAPQPASSDNEEIILVVDLMKVVVVHGCVFTCVRTRVYVCARACVCVCVRVRAHARGCSSLDWSCPLLKGFPAW